MEDNVGFLASEVVRSTDLFLNLDVQVESRNRDLKKHMKIFSSNATLVPTIIYMNIYSKLYIRFYLRI